MKAAVITLLVSLLTLSAQAQLIKNMLNPKPGPAPTGESYATQAKQQALRAEAFAAQAKLLAKEARSLRSTGNIALYKQKIMASQEAHRNSAIAHQVTANDYLASSHLYQESGNRKMMELASTASQAHRDSARAHFIAAGPPPAPKKKSLTALGGPQ